MCTSVGTAGSIGAGAVWAHGIVGAHLCVHTVAGIGVCAPSVRRTHARVHVCIYIYIFVFIYIHPFPCFRVGTRLCGGEHGCPRVHTRVRGGWGGVHPGVPPRVGGCSSPMHTCDPTHIRVPPHAHVHTRVPHAGAPPLRTHSHGCACPPRVHVPPSTHLGGCCGCPLKP